ncbi:Potassium voltage-gated channel sub D member 2 [Lobulomyces angularis]|nr:Potassium voltage-gated channel sub D member 2 [Lobulomyces angularis]
MLEKSRNKSSIPWRRRLYIFLNPNHSKKSFSFGKLFFYFSGLLILISIGNLCAMTVPSVTNNPNNRKTLFIIDLFCVLVFTFELILNLMSLSSFKAYFSWTTFIDLIAIVPFYVECIMNFVNNGTEGFFITLISVQRPSIIWFLRMIRIVRMFKLLRMSSRLRLLSKAIKHSMSGIIVLVSLIPMMIVFFATLLYFAERSGSVWVEDHWKYLPEYQGTISPFQSIPDCFWLTIVTLTTVGFGDQIPQTVLGKIALSLNMIASIFIVAFPLTMITLQYSQIVRFSAQKKRRRKFENNKSNLTLQNDINNSTDDFFDMFQVTDNNDNNKPGDNFNKNNDFDYNNDIQSRKKKKKLDVINETASFASICIDIFEDKVEKNNYTKPTLNNESTLAEDAHHNLTYDELNKFNDEIEIFNANYSMKENHNSESDINQSVSNKCVTNEIKGNFFDRKKSAISTKLRNSFHIPSTENLRKRQGTENCKIERSKQRAHSLSCLSGKTLEDDKAFQDQTSEVLTYKTKSQILKVNSSGAVFMGTALAEDNMQKFGVDPYEIEAEVEQTLGGIPRIVEFSITDWKCDENQDKLSMNIRIDNDKKYRDLILLLAKFQS